MPPKQKTYLGGFQTTHLDKKFYETYIPKAIELGFDPYLYVAHTLKELGGIREQGKEQIGKSRPGVELTEASMFPAGKPGHLGARGTYGPGAIALGDPGGKRFMKEDIVPTIHGEPVEFKGENWTVGWNPKVFGVPNLFALRKENPELFLETYNY